AIHQLHVQLELTQHELKGVQQALTAKDRVKNKKKVLPLYAHSLERHGGATWWSPSLKREADARAAAFEAHQQQVEAEKATQKELQHTQKLLKEKQQQQKREARIREKEERDQQKAEQAEEAAERRTERERQKQARDAAKALQLSQKGKHKASQKAVPRKKQNRGVAAAQSGAAAESLVQVAPTTTTRRGRTSTLPARFV
ncbi:hypothetical protein BU25DRAFT_461603, partial [Macroventuria anomochaeta]